jgi:hypothetical protein
LPFLETLNPIIQGLPSDLETVGNFVHGFFLV